MNDDLVKRLRDLGDHDEGKANDARIEGAG